MSHTQPLPQIPHFDECHFGCPRPCVPRSLAPSLPSRDSSRTCEIQPCDQEPLYFHPSLSDTAKATHCFTHRPLGFVREKKKKLTPITPLAKGYCQFEGCTKSPSHSYPSQPRATHCPAHRARGMRDHRHRLCSHVSPNPCPRQPSFGWAWEGRRSFCAAHKQEGMADVRKGSGCERSGCGKRASYGHAKQKACLCPAHREQGMINFVAGVSVGKRECREGVECSLHRRGGLKFLSYNSSCAARCCRC